MGILIIAEHNNRELHQDTYRVISAAFSINSNIDLLIIGYQCQNVIDQAKNLPLRTILRIDAPHYQDQPAENCAERIIAIVEKYDHILAASGSGSRGYMPRVAALLNVNQISNVIKIISADTFVQARYSGDVNAMVQSQDRIKVMVLKAASFPFTRFDNEEKTINPVVEELEIGPDLQLSKIENRTESEGDLPDLKTAKIIVSGGKGLESKEQFDKLILPLAEKLKGAVGASRAAIDSGFISSRYQVGLSGQTVAPDLYIAIGISGAVQHLSAVLDAGTIVAINNNPNAPIFDVADYGLVADLFEAVPKWLDQQAE
ncbi:electron transfer flavoprotein subunit alpha/FixB family protein [Magnetococcales bacterium HHB-1]